MNLGLAISEWTNGE